MNVGEGAHIIGQGKNGLRSYSELLYDKEYINDISNLMDKVEELLDRSIEPADTDYVIAEPYKGGEYFDLSRIDF